MLLSALFLALSWSLTSAVLSPLSSFEDDNECALYLSGPGRTSSYDYSLNLLRGNFGYEGQHTCITYDAVNRAYLEARKRILVAQPKGDWTPEDYASVGELILDISTNLARTYGLSYEEIEKGLPLIDTSRTLIREVCPPVFSHVECRAGKYRRLDGLCNNLENPTWGAINSPFQRLIGPLFADGINSPRIAHSGRDLPLSRTVSRTMHPDEGFHDHAGTVMVIAWGQFMDHDYTLTGTPLDPRNRNDPEECCKRPPHQKHPYCNEIRIPDDDYFYRLFGVKCIDFVRAFPSPRPGCRLGSRIPFNTLTGVLDGNTVYGVTEKFGRKLRTGYGGLLRMNPIFKEFGLKDLLPLKLDIPDEGCTRPNKNMYCFEGGEIRVNEQLVLTVMHTLMAREHNRVAVGLTSVNPHWDDETLYQEARRIVIAEIQHITYNEFLPILLGKDVMEKFGLVVEKEGYWDGYDHSVNPDVIASFAAAAYRFGHSLLPTAVERWSKAHKFIASKRLSELIRRPYDLYRAGVLDEYVMGLMNQVAQAMDDSITQEVTNHLFKKVGARFGMDLVSFNMQRGREFGLPGYMEFRKFCGLPWTDDFQGLFGSMPNETVRKYEKLFEHPVDVDLWSGGVSEKPLPGSMLGPTFACIIATQFSYSKRGDRFWYELPNQPSSFTPEQLQEVRKGRLARIICDNTDIIDTVQLYPFVLPDPELNPRIPCRSGILPSIDFSKWAETPPFPGAAKQFMTRAFVPDRQENTDVAKNNTTENLTTESIKQDQIETTEILNETTTLPTTTSTISLTTTTTTSSTTTSSSTTTPSSTTLESIPREDIDKILDILKNTTTDENLKDPLIAENTIVNATTAVINCAINCTKNLNENKTETQENQGNNTLERYPANTDIPEITKNMSANNRSNVERHRRSDFNNNNEPLKAPLLVNYDVSHSQREREDLLPPGVVKGSADFNIETLHDDPETTTENQLKSGQYQQPYHGHDEHYKSQANSKIIEKNGLKNQNPVNVRYHNHHGKMSHEYVVLHDPSEINVYGKKHKEPKTNQPKDNREEISYYPPKQRKSNTEISSEEDDRQNQKKHNKKYESSRNYPEKNKSVNYSPSKSNHGHKQIKDDDDIDEDEENSNEKRGSKENSKKSHPDHEKLEKEIINSAEDEDEEKPYRNLPVKYRNVKPRSYEESEEKVPRNAHYDSEESRERYKPKPLTEESHSNDDESTERQTDSQENVSDYKDKSYQYKSPLQIQNSKYETKPQTKRYHWVNDKNKKYRYNKHDHKEHKPQTNYESKESKKPYVKSKPNNYDREELNQDHDSGKKQKLGHVPYKNTYLRDENESHEGSNYEKSKKYSKPYIKKNTHDIVKKPNDKNDKKPSEDRYKSDQHEGKKHYYNEKTRNDDSDEDDSSSETDDIPHQSITDDSRPLKEARRTQEHENSEDDSRERDESEEDKPIIKPIIKIYNKHNYRKNDPRHQDDKSVEDESKESDESSQQNREEYKLPLKEKYRNTPIRNARHEKDQAKSKKPYSKYNDYSDNKAKKPHKIQEVDLSDFSHERVQLNKNGDVESIPDSDESPDNYKINEKPKNNHKHIADDLNEYKRYNSKKLHSNKHNSEKYKKHNPDDSDEFQQNQDPKELNHENHEKYNLHDSIKHHNNDSYRESKNINPQRYQQYDPSPDDEKININVGEVKPVVELGHDSSSSSEEKDSEDKSTSEDGSLEDFLREGGNTRKKLNSLSDIQPARIKESPDVKQQVERIPLNYKHDKNNAAKGSEEQQNPVKEIPVNNDDDDDEPEITQSKVPEKEIQYDENLNYKFDDVQVKLPDIKLPEDVLDFNYEQSFYEPGNKKNSKIYHKDDDDEEQSGKEDDNDDEVRHHHHHGNDDDDQGQGEDNEDEDDGHDHENYDYTSSPYKQKKKKKVDVRGQFDYTKSPFERQQEAEEDEEDLYEKFVRERFGKRQLPEQSSGRLHDGRVSPSSPVLYHNLQKILHKTKKTMKEAEQSGDPNAGYAWTLEYAEPLVEI